jgi:large subunit ribosomal protein L7/L12
MIEIEKIVDQLSKLTVMEAAQLATALEKAWGVSAAVNVVSSPVAQSESVAPQKEKTVFDVMLKSFGNEKIKVIKVVKEITGLGLAESRNKVISVSSGLVLLKESVDQKTAETLKEKLVAAGAEVELK